MRKLQMWLILSIGIAGMIAGCAGTGSGKADRMSIHLVAAANANRNTPVAVDMVFVFDPILRDMLHNYSAAAWFAGRNELLNRNGEFIKVISERVHPGEYRVVPEFPAGSREAVAGFIFAQYVTPGAHRFLFTPPAALKVTLREKEFAVTGR